jgi:hypothetical protein
MKEALKRATDKYIKITFNLRHTKHKVITYFELYGYIMEVEDRNISFKDNYNHEFIIPINRIRDFALAGERRTAEEGTEVIQKEIKKLERKTETSQITKDDEQICIE